MTNFRKILIAYIAHVADRRVGELELPANLMTLDRKENGELHKAAAEAVENVGCDFVTAADLRDTAKRYGVDDAAPVPAAPLPALDDDLRFILGRPNFACGPLAHAFRADGAEIAAKAEAEQAFVIHKMLGYYLDDPATWRARLQAEIDALKGRLEAAAAGAAVGPGA